MKQFKRYQAKPVELEAVRRAEDDSNWREIAAILDIDTSRMVRPPLIVNVPSAKGMKPLRRGDWLLRTGDGTLGALDDENFRKAYEPMDVAEEDVDEDELELA